MPSGTTEPCLRATGDRIGISRLAVDMIGRPDNVIVLAADHGWHYQVLVMNRRWVEDQDGEISPEIPPGSYREARMYYQRGRRGGAVIVGANDVLLKVIKRGRTYQMMDRTRGGILFRIPKVGRP